MPRRSRATPRRITIILLLVTFLGLGTGTLAHLHDLQHAAEDAAEDRADRSAGLPVEHHHHDESNCRVHAQLHVPLIAAAWAMPPMWVGPSIAALPPLVRPLLHRGPPGRADCRDPPVPLPA